jgi:uncharacterized protein (TIGR03067 family)
MKTRALVLGAAVLLVAAADEAAKKDQDKMQGQWEAVGIEYNGKDLKADGVKLTFTFKGNKATLSGSDEITKDFSGFTFKLDPSTNPKCIDMTVTAGDQKDSVIEGIYEFKGEELRICAKITEKARPTKFASPEGEFIGLMTLKRVKD